MVNYRTNRLAAACKRAITHGYRGAMFPWESDDAGEESTPTFALTGPLEHHITADIAIACWNYYCVTHDLHWLRSHGYPLMKAVADFWVSRAERNEDGSYSIRSVVGADEYAIGVDDLSLIHIYFNTPGVLMANAAIHAWGGAHLELGEHMLTTEY